MGLEYLNMNAVLNLFFLEMALHIRHIPPPGGNNTTNSNRDLICLIRAFSL